MPQRLLFLDFETYYDSEYTLRKMTPVEYILGRRYETIMMAAALNDGPIKAIDAPDIPAYLAEHDPDVTTTVTFNSLFDNCILAWHYGYVPKRMLDVMGMARALRGHVLPSVSLARVAEHLGLGEKGHEVDSVKGLTRRQIRTHVGMWDRYSEYNKNDVYLMREAFYKLAPEFPAAERRIMDKVLRCAVCPRFHVDVNLLEAHLKELRRQKIELMAVAAIGNAAFCDPIGPIGAKAALMSNVKFQEELEKLGVEIEYKVSPSGNKIPAFAKTDEFMELLQKHEDPRVQALAAARLGLKSTIEETRTQRFINIGKLPWSSYRDGSPRLYSGGTLPIPLRYSGAHTHRLSGDWKMNAQNLPSGRNAPSKLRKSIIAPPDHKCVKVDLSQIECRINALLCDDTYLLTAFADKDDPYSTLATMIFGINSDELKARGGKNSLERFIGKAGELGLGFGCGPDKFYNMVLRSGRLMGMDMKALKQVWTLTLAKKSVETYRRLHRPIKNTWAHLDGILRTAWCDFGPPIKFGPCVVEPGAVLLPNYMRMRYEVLSTDPMDLRYKYGREVHHMYGSKFLENIVQALARIVIMNAALRLSGRGYEFAHQEHDALTFIVPDNDVDNAKKIIYEEATRHPSWAHTLPLDADISVGQSYGG